MLREILIKSLLYFVTKGLSWKRIRWPWPTSLSSSTSPPISCSNERHIMEACHKTVKTWRLEKTCSLLEIYSRTYKGHRASVHRYHIKALTLIKKAGENLLSSPDLLYNSLFGACLHIFKFSTSSIFFLNYQAIFKQILGRVFSGEKH